METRVLYFTSPLQVETRSENLAEPGPGQVWVQTCCSAISSGTELLIYCGQFPESLPVDATIPALVGQFAYPLRYGYSSVGQVSACGPGVDPSWHGRRVFAFQPHCSHFLSQPAELQPIPDDIPDEDAVFLPNMETAVNFVMDGAPRLGEAVVVFGQGVIGLLTTALLSAFPLSNLVTLDLHPLRRQNSLAAGAHAALDPAAPQVLDEARQLLGGGADLAYELAGAGNALDQAIAVTGFAGRIILGAWYGRKRTSLDLGGHFHRSRIQLISSQVSSLSPELSGRWTKERRFTLAWDMLRKVQPSRWITHRFPLSQSQAAYAQLHQAPEQTLQILFTE